MIQNVFQKNICKQNHMGSLNEEETGARKMRGFLIRMAEVRKMKKKKHCIGRTNVRSEQTR